MSNRLEFEKKGFFTLRNFFTKEQMTNVNNDLEKIADNNYSDIIHPHNESDEVKKLIFDKNLNDLEIR